MTDLPAFRVLPRLSGDDEFFWTSGADGKLRFLRCPHDGTYVHPPAPVCPECLRKDLAPEAVSGRATVATYTVNMQPWIPGFDPPYVVAMVEIQEDPKVRVMTNIVNCSPDDVEIGMDVQVLFDERDGTYIPIFEPVR